jgi:hypothetical protein
MTEVRRVHSVAKISGELRKIGGSHGTRWLLAATLSVAMLMVLSTTASAGALGAAHALRGHVRADNSTSSTDCARASGPVKWGFDFATRSGGAVEYGTAGGCRGGGASGATGEAQSIGGIQVRVPVKTSVGTRNLTADLSARFAVSLAASDGHRASATPICNTGLTATSYRETYYGWNGTYYNYTSGNRSYNFTDFLNFYEVESTDNGSNVSFGTGTPPSPFSYNNTTYYLNERSFGMQGACTATANVGLTVHAYLRDLDSGTYVPRAADSFGAHDTLLQAAVTIEQTIDWYCFSEISWLGDGYGSSPASQGSWTNTSFCQNDNSTVLSSVSTAYPVVTLNSSSNSLSWSMSDDVAGSMTWLHTFDHYHYYLLVVDVSAVLSAETSWIGGAASYGFDMGLGSNGFQFGSIVES